MRLPILLFLLPALTLASPLAAAAALADPDCANSGSGNSGCANSGIGNTGTSNSGINNCGTNLSGIGEGCGDDDDDDDNNNYNAGVVVNTPTVTDNGWAATQTLAGPTSTITISADEYRRSDCGYWEAQGFWCSAGERRGAGLWAVGLGLLVGVGAVV